MQRTVGARAPRPTAAAAACWWRRSRRPTAGWRPAAARHQRSTLAPPATGLAALPLAAPVHPAPHLCRPPSPPVPRARTVASRWRRERAWAAALCHARREKQPERPSARDAVFVARSRACTRHALLHLCLPVGAGFRRAARVAVAAAGARVATSAPRERLRLTRHSPSLAKATQHCTPTDRRCTHLTRSPGLLGFTHPRAHSLDAFTSQRRRYSKLHARRRESVCCCYITRTAFVVVHAVQRLLCSKTQQTSVLTISHDAAAKPSLDASV
jgi:hypothetical protein